LDTSSEVFSSAQRDAAEEIHRKNEDRAAKKRAVEAYNKALQSRKAVDRAKEHFKSAKALLAQKNAALKQAQNYKQRSDKITEIDADLATVTLLHTCKHKHWGKSLALPSAHMHSLAQGVVQQLVDKDSAKQREFFAAFTSNHLIRTFPSWHVTEHTPYANYDPVLQWSLGCQLVSMNFHSVDERVLVTDGRFRANSSSGYILKPDYLIDDTKQRERQERWKFSILSANCLPKPESGMGRKGLSAVTGTSMHYINPFVKVSIYDETSSSGKVVHATRPVLRNGLNPIWKEMNDVEVAIPSPSLAILLFTVWDKTDSGADDFIAAAALPVSCIREGYRSVALFDSMHSRCGPYAFASLLVKAQKLST
jgi:phosphatidylinositol phospholipase C delta